MDLYLNTQTIIIVVVAILVIILLVKLFKKVVRTVLILIVLAGLAFYIFVYSNIFNGSEHSKYSIDYLKDKYCNQMLTEKDSVKCFLIVTPIYDDMKKNYTDEELLKLEKNPIEYFKVLNQSIKKNKSSIMKNLAKNKQEQLWESFLQDLKKNYPDEQLAQ